MDGEGSPLQTPLSPDADELGGGSVADSVRLMEFKL